MELQLQPKSKHSTTPTPLIYFKAFFSLTLFVSHAPFSVISVQYVCM